MRVTSRRSWWWLPAALALAGCGGGQQTQPDPLVADPPLGASEGASEGASGTELQRGIAYIKNEKWDEAKAHLEKALASKPDNAEAAYYLGVAKERSGDRPGAEQAYKQALDNDPKLSDAALNLAALYLDEPPRPAEAIAILVKAIEKSPDNARLHQNLAYAHALQGDVANASKHYEAAIAKGGDSAEIRFAYGAMLFEAKQLDKAAEQLKKALAGAPDEPAMLATIGRMLGHAHAFGDCVKAFDRALQKKPHPELHVARGVCRHELADEPGARADYEAAIKLDPKFAPAHYYLGLSWLADKQRQKGITALEQAAKLGGDTEIGKRAREKVKELSKKR